LKLQKTLEHIFFQEAKRSGKPSVVLCDRGSMDNKAFMSPELWQKLLTAEKYTLVELRDGRYDAVIHLVTAAIGVPEFYTLANNAARSGSLQQAAIQDEKIREAWLGHPHLRVIGNHTNFEEKIRRVIAIICNIVGVPEPIERERKFLVSNLKLDEIPVKKESIYIEQTYLLSKSGSVRVRKRGQHDHFTYTYTIKQKLGPGKNIEKEKTITEKEYLDLLIQADPSRQTIKKERTCFLWNHQYFELDHFITPRPGLWLLEAEIETDDEQINLPPFPKIEKEVTDDPSYSTAEIAKSMIF
jgi:CYTH domain-containing protein